MMTDGQWERAAAVTVAAIRIAFATHSRALTGSLAIEKNNKIRVMNAFRLENTEHHPISIDNFVFLSFHSFWLIDALHASIYLVQLMSMRRCLLFLSFGVRTTDRRAYSVRFVHSERNTMCNSFNNRALDTGPIHSHDSFFSSSSPN